MAFYSFQGIRPVVDASAFVHPTACVIGDVIIGPECYIGPGASLRGDEGRIVIGACANVQDNCVAHAFPGTDVILEDFAHVGHAAVLHGCRLGRNTLVGMNSVLMDGAVIEEDSFVGAMSFVRAGFVVPPRSLAFGSPARVMRPLTDDEMAWKKEGTEEYRRLARLSLQSLRECAPLAEAEADRPRLESLVPTLQEYRAGRS